MAMPSRAALTKANRLRALISETVQPGRVNSARRDRNLPPYRRCCLNIFAETYPTATTYLSTVDPFYTKRGDTLSQGRVGDVPRNVEKGGAALLALSL